MNEGGIHRVFGATVSAFFFNITNPEVLSACLWGIQLWYTSFQGWTLRSVGSPGKRQKYICGFRVPLGAPVRQTKSSRSELSKFACELLPRELSELGKLSYLTMLSASFAAGVSLGTLWAGASRGTRKLQRFLSLPGRTDSTRIVKHWKDVSPDAPKKHA